MFQPFIKLENKYLPKLKALKKTFLVSQSYPRGIDHFAEALKTPLLFTDYDDGGLAKTHWNAIKEDPLAAILDLNNKKHWDKLQDMLKPDSAYSVFWSVFPSREEVEKRMDLKYKDHMMRYISQKLGWHVSGTAKMNPKIEVIFGELQVHLKYGNYDRVRVKFSDIERA